MLDSRGWGQKWEHATLPRQTSTTDTMRGEASDFAAMRDAFRNAGFCTEASPRIVSVCLLYTSDAADE